MLQQICFSDLPLLTNDIIENVEKLIAAGAEVVELMMDGDKWGDMEELFPILTEELKTLPVRYTIHPPAWDINMTSENKAIREASFHEYRKAIEFASMINAQHVVIHPGFCFCPQFDKEIGKKRAKQFIHELCDIARPLNVSLAIENVGYNGSSLFTREEFEHFLDDIDEIAGYLIDVGHAHLNGWDIASTIINVKNRLLALHLHDNTATGDDHLPIGQGTIDWTAIFNAITDETIDCQLILEYAPATDLQLLTEGKAVILNELAKRSKVG